MKKVVRIVPPPPGADGITRTQGTQVFTGDGHLIGRVTRIELSAEVGDVWRAVIHTLVQIEEIAGIDAEVVEVETTTLESTSRTWSAT